MHLEFGCTPLIFSLNWLLRAIDFELFKFDENGHDNITRSKKMYDGVWNVDKTKR